MTETDAATVHRHVVVDGPVARAFEVFTQRLGDFKPKEHNLLNSPIAERVFEPHVGGHIYDRAEDGSQCRLRPAASSRLQLGYRPVQLGYRPAVAGRGRPGALQRSRSPVRR